MYPKLTMQQTLPYHPEKSSDLRRKCTLVLGDGFTQGYLRAFGLHERVRCRIRDHFQNVETLRYVATRGDRFASGSPLWEPCKWPRLFEAIGQFGAFDSWGFYRSLSNQLLNPDRGHGGTTYHSSTLSFEVRCYLWHLFRSVQTEIDAYMVGRTPPEYKEWLWYPLLHVLLNEFNVSVISFNYDLVCEAVLGANFNTGVTYLTDRPVWVPRANVPLVKLHGSINLHAPTPISAFTGHQPNPWLAQIDVQDSLTFGVMRPYDMTHFPEVPDIVPPGHYGVDRFHPWAAETQFAKSMLTQAEIVVFCGLSGADPDTPEVQDLISVIVPRRTVFQVGLQTATNDDDQNELAQALRARALDRIFVRAEELPSVLSVLSERELLLNDWSTAFPFEPWQS
jgi:hypothetical protein